jgi:hypothetical protein
LVAMHLLFFSLPTKALGFVLPGPVVGVWFALLAIWTPINLFQTLRGVYGSSLLGERLKTFIVWTTSVMAFSVVPTAVLIFSLAQL